MELADSSSTAPASFEPEGSAASALTETAISEPLSAEAADAPRSLLNSPITVAVNLTGNCWMRVTIDGKTQFEDMLTKGMQKTWTAQQEIKIRAGNAGAVLLSLNGAAAQPVGEINEIKNLTFTPNSTPEEIEL